MNKPSKKFTQAIVIIFAAWLISIGIIYIKAWIGPSSAPAAGSGAISVGSGGKVGIGDTSPGAMFEVSASGGTDDLLMLSSDDANNGDRLIVKNGGNVGIGTTDPAGYKLNVNGNVNATAYYGDGSNLTGISTTGVWKLVSEVTLTSPQNGITISGLDGNVDKTYRYIISSRGTSNIQMGLQFNGDTAVNYMDAGFFNRSGATQYKNAASTSIIDLGNTPGGSNYEYFSEGVIYAKSGYKRRVVGHTFALDGSGTAPLAGTYGGLWNNTSANITSIKFSQGYNMEAGTHVELWARR